MDKRLAAYEALWAKTKQVPRSRLLGEVTGRSMIAVREDWHDWYYSEGGIFMSEATRDCHFAAATELEKVGRERGESELTEDHYRPVYDSVKALRDEMVDELRARLDLQTLLRGCWPWCKES